MWLTIALLLGAMAGAGWLFGVHAEREGSAAEPWPWEPGSPRRVGPSWVVACLLIVALLYLLRIRQPSANLRIVIAVLLFAPAIPGWFAGYNAEKRDYPDFVARVFGDLPSGCVVMWVIWICILFLWSRTQ